MYACVVLWQCLFGREHDLIKECHGSRSSHFIVWNNMSLVIEIIDEMICHDSWILNQNLGKLLDVFFIDHLYK